MTVYLTITYVGSDREARNAHSHGPHRAPAGELAPPHRAADRYRHSHDHGSRNSSAGSSILPLSFWRLWR